MLKELESYIYKKTRSHGEGRSEAGPNGPKPVRPGVRPGAHPGAVRPDKRSIIITTRAPVGANNHIAQWCREPERGSVSLKVVQSVGKDKL